MSLFDKRSQVYGPETFSMGEFDVNADGYYRNVVTVPIDTKPRRMLYVKVASDALVDVVVAKEDRSSAMHKEHVTDAVLGPIPTEKSHSMGVIIGVFRGDRANVTLEVWMDR